MQVGQTISHYKILNRIGSGGAGDVYRAEDTKLGRIVAIKFLRGDQMADESMRSRFLREATATAALEHPNINTIYEVDEQDGRIFIVMAYVEGETLQKRIADSRLPLEQVLEFAAQLADALAAAHAAGVVHRDVKTGNVMVAEPKLGAEPQIKLLDFGVAQLSDKSSELTKQGHSVGTPAYMSPEQATGAETDHRTDIWALGVVLYEMTAGRRPFEGDYEAETLYAIVNEDPPHPASGRPGAPEQLHEIILKSLRKEPERRYQQASQVAAELRAIKVPLEATTAELRPVEVVAQEPGGRSRPYLLAASLLFALGLGYWALRPASQSGDLQLSWQRESPLTTYPGVEQSPSFSPNGEEVAFTWVRPGIAEADIYIRSLGTDEPRRFTTNEKSDYRPQWSPDGENIAWLRTSFGAAPEVVQASVEGGPERVRTRISASTVRSPGPRFGWAPDAKTLVISERESDAGSFAIYALRDDGTRLRLTSPPAPLSDSSPAISPDGSKLAFLRSFGLGHADAFWVELGEDLTPEGQPRRLTDQSDDAQSLVWSPDGAYLVYSAESQLWRVELADGISKPMALGLFTGGPTYLSFVPSGDLLAFSRQTGSATVRRLPSELQPNQPAAGDALISSTGYDTSPDFSPDGTTIVFSSDRRGRRGVFLANADGGNVRPLHYDPDAESGAARWSPDGRWIAFDSTAGEGANIFVIPANGGEAVQATTNLADDVTPSWSHDGEWIYFSSNRSGVKQIWKKQIGEDAAYQVTTNGGEKAFESADGQFLYFQRGGLAGPLLRVPSNGGEEKLIEKSVYGRNIAMAGNSVYFIAQPDPAGAGTFQLRRYDPRTEEVSTVVALDPELNIYSGLTVSKQTGEVLFVTRSFEGDLVMAEKSE